MQGLSLLEDFLYVMSLRPASLGADEVDVDLAETPSSISLYKKP